MFSKLALICIVISFVSADADSLEDDWDSKFIESKKYEYYLEKSKNNVNKGCAVNEMAAYGLVADVNSLSDPNPICPQMTTGNCCGKQAQKQIETYWEVDDRHQSLYYMSYLKMSKYILGQGSNYQKLASYIIEKTKKLKLIGADKQGGTDQNQDANNNDGLSFTYDYHEKCADAAKKLIKIEFVDKRKALDYYAKLNKKMQFMQNSRRGFYCMLCNAKATDYIKTYRAILTSTLYFSNDFCKMLYSQTFTSVYGIYRQWNPFMKYVLEMLMCVKPKNQEGRTQQNDVPNQEQSENEEVIDMSFDLSQKDPTRSLTKEAKELLKNPLGVKGKGWMELCFDSDPTGNLFGIMCMGFCEEFKMTKRSKLLDGDLNSMKTLYDHIRKYEFAFDNPKNSFFENDVLDLKFQVNKNYKDLMSNYNFYRSLSKKIDFAKYDTSFFPQIFTHGVDPMALSKGTTLRFRYMNVSVLRLVVVFFLSLLLPREF